MAFQLEACNAIGTMGTGPGGAPCATVGPVPRASEAGPAGDLGTHAKFRSTLRAERFALQSVARTLLSKERVGHCCRTRQKGSQVSVWRALDHGGAHFKGLQTCGSVWHCPVCAAKISERRRAELEAAIAVHRASGGDVLLLTVTNSHHCGHALRDLLEGQEKALHRFRSARQSRVIWNDMGVVGTVRALEVTHGRNGWHPHYHFLLFISKPLRNLAHLKESLGVRWIDCCRAAGLPLPDLAHGVDLRGGEWAARYASKWGLEQEMTKAHIKKAKGGGRTPFDLLRLALDTGEAEACDLFKEFAKQFKGKRQLVWSRGLKALLRVEELSDQEISERADEDAELLGRLELDDWRRILRFDLRAKVLEAAEHGWSQVVTLLESVRVAESSPDQSVIP